MLKTAQIPKPQDLAVVREDVDYIIVNDGKNNHLAMRKPLKPDRWIERRDTQGRLISLCLKVPGVNDS